MLKRGKARLASHFWRTWTPGGRKNWKKGPDYLLNCHDNAEAKAIIVPIGIDLVALGTAQAF